MSRISKGGKRQAPAKRNGQPLSTTSKISTRRRYNRLALDKINNELANTPKCCKPTLLPNVLRDFEGQDDMETDENEDDTAPSGNESQDSSRDEQYDNSDSDSVASSDSHRSRNSNDTDRSNDFE